MDIEDQIALVSGAGIGLAAGIVGREGKESIKLFRKVIEINLFGTYNLMSYAAQAMTDLPVLETGERGVIINIASAAYEDGQERQAAYSTSRVQLPPCACRLRESSRSTAFGS